MAFTYNFFFVGALIMTLVFFWPKHRYRMPPGPPGYPVVGNLLQMPKDFLQYQLDAWSREYGPLFSLNVAGQPWLVVNNAKTSADVLDRLSAVTSDRPGWIKANQFMSRYDGLAAAPHGPKWRLFRKGAHEALNIRVCGVYCAMQEEEAVILVKGLLQHPEVKLVTHISRAASSIVWRALYGGESLLLNKPHDSQRIEDMMGYLLKSMLPLNSVVDLIPPLRHLVARSKFLRKAADRYYQEATDIYTRLFDGACSLATSAVPSACRIFQSLGEKHNITRVQSAWSAGILFTAGQDTTATTMRWFVQAMLLYPQVAQKAQQELDTVVGDRPPTFADKENLPYIQACVKEVLRWRPSAPLSIPHCASEEFEYHGYIIPKGTLIIDNLWSILHDPGLYPEPHIFNPSRFLDDNGRLKPGAPDTHDDYIGFGHGRRICPGRDLATNSLFIMIAYLLWALELKKPKDKDGRELTPDPMAMIDLFVAVHPKPFEIEVAPRFVEVLQKLA